MVRVTRLHRVGRPFESGRVYVTRQSNDYMRAYMLARYHRRRTEWVERLGGVCVECGTTESLEFDHVDPVSKTADVARILAGGSERRVEAEMRLCVLRCAEHHARKTVCEAGRAVEHGGGVSGKRNCPCGPCRGRKAEYMRSYR